MGLSVSLYTNIKRSDDPENDDGFLVNVASESWKYKVKNLEYEKYYSGDLDYGIVSYPYSAHYNFRVYLLQLSNQVDYLTEPNSQSRHIKDIKWDSLVPDKPFYELINFSDCEGCFDWEISEKLLTDFKKYELDSKNKGNENPLDRFHYHYEDWIRLLELSVEHKGVVVFM